MNQQKKKIQKKLMKKYQKKKEFLLNSQKIQLNMAYILNILLRVLLLMMN